MRLCAAAGITMAAFVTAHSCNSQGTQTVKILAGDRFENPLPAEEESCGVIQTDHGRHSQQENIAMNLEVFMDYIHTFLAQTGFAAESFEAAAEGLELYLKDISVGAKWALPLPRKTKQMLIFARRIFNVMVDSVERLKQFSFEGSRDRYLVNCIVEINVSLLSLYDFYGVPDPTIHGYEGKISLFTMLVNSWREEFLRLPGVGYGVRVLFFKKWREAEKSLRELASFIQNIDGRDE